MMLNLVTMWFAKKEKSLEDSSDLQYTPDEVAIKQVLVNCLEEWYGNLFQHQVIAVPQDNLVNEMLKLLEKYK